MRLDPALNGSPLGSGLDLAGCYELCRRVEKAHSRTYYFSTSLLPGEVRPRVHALYAFMRYADEIVDNPGNLDLAEQLTALQSFEDETLAAMAGAPVANPVLRAFADTAVACRIEAGLVRAFMKSMKMDTGVFRYPAYADLEEYVYGSVEAQGYDVFASRAETSLACKLRVAAMCAASDPGEWTARLREVRPKGDVAIPH
jgi:15-cis-phytoene synthase